MFDGVGIADVPIVRPVLLDGQAVRVPVSRAARGLFETLGVRPAVGRLFTESENRPGGPAVAIVSDAFWRGALDSRPPGSAAVTLGRERFTIVGVLPPDFRYFGDGMAWTDPADVWTPMERDTNLGSRTSHGFHVVARLRGQVTLEQARSEMNQLAQQLKSQHKQPTQADSVLLTPLQDVVTRRARDPLRLLLYAAGSVLLVSCLNLAAAILAHGLHRRRELSIRIALGATRATLARHLLIDAAVLSVPAAATGLLLAALAFRLIRATAPGTLPRLDEATLDGGAVVLASVASTITACVAGLIPSVVLSRRTLVDRLRTHGAAVGPRDQRRLWIGFVVAQVMLTVVLLCGTGLLVRSFLAALAVDVGYDARDVLAVDVALPESSYSEPARRIAFYDAALETLRATPGIRAAGLTSALPDNWSIHTSGTSRDLPRARTVLAGYRLVDAGYFDAIGIGRLAGWERALAEGALIDRRLQDQLWEGRSPLGDRVMNGFSDVPLTVAGVVGTVREWYQGDDTTGAIYVDFRVRPQRIGAMHFVVRHDGNLPAAVQSVRRAVGAVDPLVPLTIESLEVRTAESLGGRRLMLVLSGGFAIVALLLAAAGVYAMVAFAVGRQRREAAIRLALGAHPSSLRVHVLRQGFGPSSLGVVLGLILAVPAGRAIRTQLFQVQPVDPVVLACAAATIVLAAILASVAPAMRAARVDPAAALRQD
jgi:putative ABC transport system permease protein